MIQTFPATQTDGSPLKSITSVLLQRRATSGFRPEEVPEEFVNAILGFAAQAPSSYNLQPWRFVVVQAPENRKRLMRITKETKLAEAPLVVIALGMTREWKDHADEVFREAALKRDGAARPRQVEQHKQEAFDALTRIRMDVWVNRNVMIAVTSLMLVAEAYGLDTAPIETFESEALKREFGIPDEAEIVALLAIGRGEQPDEPGPGRFDLDRIAFREHYGRSWLQSEENGS